jgi:hypothetical protein
VIRIDGEVCSGAVVAPGIVLTAAHCVPAVEVQYGYKDVDFRTDVLGFLRPEDRRVDLALLRVATPGDAPPLLWRLPGESTAPEAQRSLLIMGFGARSANTVGAAGFRNGAELEIDEDWGCTSETARMLGCRPQRELFAYGPSGQDACGGDSGAPILEYVAPAGAPTAPLSTPKQPAPDEFSLWQIVGVVSRATAGATDACGEGTIATRIDTHAAWMIESIQTLYQRFPISE